QDALQWVAQPELPLPALADRLTEGRHAVRGRIGGLAPRQRVRDGLPELLRDGKDLRVEVADRQVEHVLAARDHHADLAGGLEDLAAGEAPGHLVDEAG